MADYIYTMELRLTPNQQKGVTLVQDIARAAGMNVYLTGGAVRDIISGFAIRDLDFTVQGNPLKLQKEFERAGAVIGGSDDDFKTLYLTLPGGVRAEVSSARIERYEKTGKPPVVSPATIIEDLRRRDFTVNAMALSLNPGSRGLLMDPFNGAADIEAKLLRVLHNYAFVEDSSRLIRASRFAARFHWPMEERTQARYESAKENNYIEYITHRAIGYELEQLAYEDDPLNVVRVLEKEGWLKVLSPHWTTAKVDNVGLSQLMKTRQQMNDLGYAPDPSPAVLHFLTARLNDKESSDIRKAIPRRDLAEAWRDLEDNAKDLAKRLSGKEAATPSRTEILQFLKPLAPQPPPPPPPPKRGRGAKAAAAQAQAQAPQAAPPKAGKKAKGVAPQAPAVAPKTAVAAKVQPKALPKPAVVPAKKSKSPPPKKAAPKSKKLAKKH